MNHEHLVAALALFCASFALSYLIVKSVTAIAGM